MAEFWFYCKLGLNHVLDPGALDHILFLCALALPFTFKNWRKIVVLATLFTLAHCVSLALSVFGIARVAVDLIEFLIPVTILLTAGLNFVNLRKAADAKNWIGQLASTAFFGLIHGFGFSNYFNMLLAGEAQKAIPLTGFATGIEISQVLIIFVVLILALATETFLHVRNAVFIGVGSGVIALLTLPMLMEAIPW